MLATIEANALHSISASNVICFFYIFSSKGKRVCTDMGNFSHVFAFCPVFKSQYTELLENCQGAVSSGRGKLLVFCAVICHV